MSIRRGSRGARVRLRRGRRSITTQTHSFHFTHGHTLPFLCSVPDLYLCILALCSSHHYTHPPFRVRECSPSEREILIPHHWPRHHDPHTQNRERQQQLRLVKALLQNIELSTRTDSCRELVQSVSVHRCCALQECWTRGDAPNVCGWVDVVDHPLGFFWDERVVGDEVLFRFGRRGFAEWSTWV